MTKNGASKIRPILLSGGADSRFWPVSRALHPRQFQRFSSDFSMLQDTVSRVKDAQLPPPVIICHSEHRFLVAEQLAEIEKTAAEIILEAESLNTAPAILTAALWMQAHHPTELMLVMPCDHFISDNGMFCRTVLEAAADAEDGKIVALGVPASNPTAEFGYLQPVDASEFSRFHSQPVSRFIEKPDTETASALIKEGFVWNSGIYVMKPDMIVEEYRERAPAILSACQDALKQGQRDLDFLRLAADPMASIEPQSFNTLVMEDTDKAVTRLLDVGWRNIHSWGAYRKDTPSDNDGNVLHGDSIIINSTNSLIQTNCMLTALIGVDGIAAIATDDAILVADLNKSDQIHAVVEKVKVSGKGQHLLHSTRHQPWGSAKIVLSGAGFQVNELMVSPGKGLSLQRHQHRAEHWVVVEGTAEVLCGDDAFLLRENESTYVPAGTLHKLGNPGCIPLRIIEIQSGDYLGGSDIERVE